VLPATTRQVATKTQLAPKTRPTRGGLGGEQKTTRTSTPWFAEDQSKDHQTPIHNLPTNKHDLRLVMCACARGGWVHVALACLLAWARQGCRFAGLELRHARNRYHHAKRRHSGCGSPVCCAHKKARHLWKRAALVVWWCGGLESG